MKRAEDMLTFELGAYQVEEVAGSGNPARVDGKAKECGMTLRGILVDELSHSCFVADFHNHAIRKISFADSV